MFKKFNYVFTFNYIFSANGADYLPTKETLSTCPVIPFSAGMSFVLTSKKQMEAARTLDKALESLVSEYDTAWALTCRYHDYDNFGMDIGALRKGRCNLLDAVNDALSARVLFFLAGQACMGQVPMISGKEVRSCAIMCCGLSSACSR